MKFVLIHLKDRLSQKEVAEAEAQARACGMTLDDWLVAVLKGAIRHPGFLMDEEAQIPSKREIFSKQEK